MRKCIKAARAVTMKRGENLIKDFALIHDGERILETGVWADLKENSIDEVTDLGEVTIVPGLINAHVHLELSHLKGKTVQGKGFLDWVKSLLANPLYELETEAVRNALRTMQENGTVFCADISTRNCAQISSIMDEQGMGFYAYCEAIGIQIPKDGAKFFPQKKFNMGKTAGAGHALYSTSPGLLQAVKKSRQ